MKAFWSVAQCLARGENSQVQICGKNVRPHPCGEVQLTLHLPTKRQRGTQLSSGDSRVNPNRSGSLARAGAIDLSKRRDD